MRIGGGLAEDRRIGQGLGGIGGGLDEDWRRTGGILEHDWMSIGRKIG